MNAPLPDDEAARLAALRECRALDTGPEDAYDDITRLAAHVCGVPIAAVSLVDADRQFFKSALGLGVRQTPREHSFCAHALLRPEEVLVVPDAADDPRFADNPLVTGDPGIRFYAGAPLVTEDGHALGSLCVIDRVPRALAPDQEAALRVLARLASAQLEGARRRAALERLAERRARAEGESRRLAAIVESSADAIWSVDLAGRVTSWNGGAERLYGYRAAEMLGGPPDRLFAPGEGQFLAEITAALARGEARENLEVRRRRKDGAWLDVSVTFSPVRDAAGAPAGVSAHARDISAQKRAEAALVKEREFTRALLESLQEGIVACDADGTLTLFNPATRALHGLPAAPLPPEQWAGHFDLYAADGMTPLRTEEIPLFRALQGEAVRDAEMVIAPKAGAARAVLCSGQALHGPGGEKLGAVVVMHDVTARRHAERELARLAAIVESAEEAILASTLDGTLVSWNRGAERLYGYPAAEMIGRHASALAPASERGLVPGVVARLRRGETVAPLEVVRVRRDGAAVDVSLSFSPIRDAAGAMVGLSCIARDVTARRRAEAALAETNARLLESEARLRRLTDAAFEGIAVSQDGVVVDVNPAFAALFGCADPAEMAGTGAAQLAAPESRALVMQKVADNDEAPYEATLQRRDGSTFRAEVRARMTRLHGRPARVTAVRDVTVRYALEEALRAGEARLAQAQRIARVGSWDLDLGTGRLVWSAQMFALLGRDPAAGVPDLEAALALYHPDDVGALRALVARAAQEGVGYERDLRGHPDTFGDGAARWFHSTAEVVADASGRPIRLTGTLADVTERRAAEEALRRNAERLAESEARLAEAQRVAGVGSWEHSLDSGALTLSAQMYRLYDLDPAGGTPTVARLLACYHPDDLAARAAVTDRAKRDGRPYELDVRIVRRDGAARWAHISGRGERDAAGRVTRLFGTVMDVHDRREAERALRENAARLAENAARLAESEAGLRAMLESAPVILYAADAAGTVTLSEGTGLAALGLAPGEAVGRSVFDFSGGDAEAEARTRRALAGEALSYDVQVSGLCLHTEVRPVRGADGAPGGIIGVCLDVTERTRAEERFRVLFEQSSDAHMLVAPGDGGAPGIIDCNPAAVALLGCADKAALLGLHPSALSPERQPDGRPSREKSPEMERLARAHGCHRFEWTHRRMDGAEFPAEITLTPVTLADRPAMLAVWHDLTERKRAEEAVRDYAVVLEFQKQELEQRQQELEQQKKELEQQKQALEEANAQLADLATTDGLTGLKNHRAFQERLAEEVSRAGRYGLPLSVVLLDVDHFKRYNDAHGHPAGDAVLRAVAGLLLDGARETDVVARYGGEEFVLILPQTDGAGARIIAERLRAAIAGADWPLRAVTASLGVASLSPGDAGGGADLVARADAALYAAKAAGRDRVASTPAHGQGDHMGSPLHGLHL